MEHSGPARVPNQMPSRTPRQRYLISAAQLSTRIDQSSDDGQLVIIELVSPTELSELPDRIPGSVRTWRPEYQLPLSEAKSNPTSC